MTKMFCRSCSNIFYKVVVDPDSGLRKLNLLCPRCGSIEITIYGSVIYKYHLCEKCKLAFKISDITARYLARHKEKPECPKCKSNITSRSTKLRYLKDSGQEIKKLDSKIVTLDSF